MTTKARRSGQTPTLQDALVAARVIESAENYARARVPELPARPHQPAPGDVVFYDDREFWRSALDHPESTWSRPVRFLDRAVFSEWVARVPGLYLEARIGTASSVHARCCGKGTILVE